MKIHAFEAAAHLQKITRRMLETILASEEEHAEDLSSLLVGMPQYHCL